MELKYEPLLLLVVCRILLLIVLNGIEISGLLPEEVPDEAFNRTKWN